MNMNFLKRNNLILSAAKNANKIFEEDYPQTFKDLRQGLTKCDDFINGKKIRPNELSIYVEGDESEFPAIQEKLFSNDQDRMHGLVFIIMAIAHIAHYAYVRSNSASEMSGVIAEADEFILSDIFEYGEKYGLIQLMQSCE